MLRDALGLLVLAVAALVSAAAHRLRHPVPDLGCDRCWDSLGPRSWRP